MRNKILNMIFFWGLNCLIQAQVRDSVHYLNAYRYILEKELAGEGEICVSDIIVDLGFFWFQDLLDDYPEEQLILKDNKKYALHEDIYSPLLSSLFPFNCDNDSISIIFFSFVEHNMLRADFITNKMYKDQFKYDRVTLFNSSPIYLYLFIFDENSTIKSVLKTSTY